MEMSGLQECRQIVQSNFQRIGALKSFILCTILLILIYWKVQILFVIVAFTVGGVGCNYFYNPEYLVPNVLRWKVRRRREPRLEDELTLLKKICPVCGKENCNRHRPELNIVAIQPWTNLKIPPKLDSAVEELLNLVMKEFVYTWYRDLSQDEAFVDELRAALRFLTAVLLRRVQKVDLPELILKKVLRIAIRHLHLYLEVKRKARKGSDLEQQTLDHYGTHLHVALQNRKSELEYLRSVVDKLFPYALPRHSLKCRSLCVLLREIVSGVLLLSSMDIIADPDIINNLLLIFFDKTPPPESRDPPQPYVPLLANFAQPLSKNNSSLHLELSDILGNNEILFPFMQFMKSEASVNVLQFYLSVEEFNSKILTPELSDKELEKLHSDLKDMYRNYCAPQAHDKIQFDDDIVSQLEEILQDALRSQVINKIGKESVKLNKLADLLKMGKGRDALSLSKLGHKLKGVFKSQTVEGDMMDDVESADTAEESSEATALRCEDDDGYTNESVMALMMAERGAPLHDLSAWRVTIPAIASKPELDNPRKNYYSYVLDVNRLDVVEDDYEASNWQVERKYNEFYVFEQKLTEFHGEFEDTALPSKKSFGTKNKEFLESKREAFQSYIQKLLTKPTLRSSELLYSFLTSECEFTTSFLPDISLGKIVKTGAMKLVKEKGQHLEPFLQSFLSSTESSKPRPSKADSDSDSVSISSEKMANSLYDNNANKDGELSPVTPAMVMPSLQYPVEGICDTILYLADHVFHVATMLQSLLHTLRPLVKHSVDHFVDWYLGYRLDRVLVEHRLLRLVNLFRDAIFFDNDPPRTEEEKKERQGETLKELRNFIPGLVGHAIGKEKFLDGTETIFQVLQYPRLNKQLSYVLLDELLVELFPELTSSAEHEILRGFGSPPDSSEELP